MLAGILRPRSAWAALTANRPMPTIKPAVKDKRGARRGVSFMGFSQNKVVQKMGRSENEPWRNKHP
jgi:hypothetical protein